MTVVFYYPSNVIGGAEILFLRVAGLLSLNHKVYYIDKKDGFSLSNIKNEKIHIIIENKENIYSLDKNSIIISVPSLYFNIHEICKKNGLKKVFFWCIHPHNFISNSFTYKIICNLKKEHQKKLLTVFGNFFYYKTRKNIQNLIENNSLFFMDSSNCIFNEYIFDLKLRNKDIFLPILLNKKNRFKSLISTKIISGWIGRLELEKITILKYVLKQIDEYYFQKKTIGVFYIIGQGSYEKKILEYTKSFKNLDIKIIKNISGNDLDDFLIKNIDLMFSIGTSALEAGYLKIPTILLNGSNGEINFNYKFSWLFNANGYDLGELIEKDNYIEKKCSLNVFEIFKLLSQKGKKEEIGYKCYKHVDMFHGSDKIIRKLEESLNIIKETDLNVNIFDIDYLFYKFKRSIKK